MFLFEPEIFLTEQDPNYRIKGSRDPLGFQSVWTRVGRELICHLSSVSIGIRDFQTLLYGRYLFDRIGGEPTRLLEFFLKFEQVSGFARRLYLVNKDVFNGSEHVDRIIENQPDSFSCSTSTEDQLLSNQKAYGIWGKYSRPFRDMQFLQRPGSLELIHTALSSKADFQAIESFAKRIYATDRTFFSRAELEVLSKIYKELTPGETSFFREHLLKVPDVSHLQNEFYDLLFKHPALITNKSFHLFSFLEIVLNRSDISSALRKCLKEIIETENVLFRLNSIFRGLQTRSVWSLVEINGDVELLQFNQPVEYVFRDSELNDLNGYFSESVLETAQNLARRNNEVCSRRGKANWISYENKRLMVYYRDGGGRVKPNAFDNSYFIECYGSLFRQIEGLSV